MEKDSVITKMPESQASLKEHQQALTVLLKEFDRVCKVLDIPYMLFAGTMLGAVRHQGFIPWDDDLDVLMMRKDYERFLEQADSVVDKEKFFLQKEFSDHWPMFFSKLRLNHTTCLEKFHPRDPEIHQGVYMDIFPCDNAAKTEWGRKIQFYASKVVIAKSLRKRGYETNNSVKKLFMNMCTLLPLSWFLKITKSGTDDSAYVHSFLGGAAVYEKNVYPRKYLERKVYIKFENNDYPVPDGYDTLLKIIYGDYMRIPPPEERAVKKHTVLVDLNHSYVLYLEHHKTMNFDIHTKSIR
ncbi:MAG: LicD family protein [Clostridia bacterium]|nr:LicD family protein [Clostridia bacterium]